MSNIDDTLILKNKKADIVFMFLRDNYHFAYLSGLNRLLIIVFALIDILLTKHTEYYLFISYVVIAIASILVDFKKPGLYLNRIWLMFDLVFVLYFMQITGKMEHPMAYLIVTTLSTGGFLYGAGLGLVLGLTSYAGHVYFSGGVSYSLFHGLTFFIIGIVSGYIGELFNYLRTKWIKDIRTMSSNFESLSEKYKVMLGIYSVSQAMSKINVSTTDILNALLTTLKQIPGAENSILRVVSGNKLISIAHYGMFSHKLAQLELKINQGFSGLVANTEKPLLISSINNNNEIINNLIQQFGKELDEEAKRELNGIKSLVSVPLKVDHNLIGTILIYNTKRHGVFGEDHLKILSIMASQFALHTYNVKILEKSKNQ